MHPESFDAVRTAIGVYTPEIRRSASAEPVHEVPTVLDVGSLDVNGTYRPIFDKLRWRYTGMDLRPGPNVDIVLGGAKDRTEYDWPVEPASFDVVVCGQTLEHVAQFWRIPGEIRRVTRPFGVVVVVVPQNQREHRYPKDYWRIMPDGMREIARMMKFEVLHVSTLKHSFSDTVGVFRAPAAPTK